MQWTLLKWKILGGILGLHKKYLGKWTHLLLLCAILIILLPTGRFVILYCEIFAWHSQFHSPKLTCTQCLHKCSSVNPTNLYKNDTVQQIFIFNGYRLSHPLLHVKHLNIKRYLTCKVCTIHVWSLKASAFIWQIKLSVHHEHASNLRMKAIQYWEEKLLDIDLQRQRKAEKVVTAPENKIHTIN